LVLNPGEKTYYIPNSKIMDYKTAGGFKNEFALSNDKVFSLASTMESIFEIDKRTRKKKLVD